MININKPTEEEVIRGSKTEHLYNHDFGGGHYFQVVFEDEHQIDVKVAPKTMMKVVYINSKEDVEGIELIKLVNDGEKERIKFSNFNIAQLRAFLELITDIDLKEVSERRIKLTMSSDLDDETIGLIKELLNNERGVGVIETILSSGVITNKDIVNTGYRLQQLENFERLLSGEKEWISYAENFKIESSKEEKVWQYFFKINPWIFGYGLDYRFNMILQDEFSASDSDADGSNTVITDYLMADNRYVTFVEIKKPSTPLFSGTKNRSRTWKLSTELIDSVSQVLEQKASGQVKVENEELFTEDGVKINQKAVDSKVILIIGDLNKEKENANNDREWAFKLKTFELFRRDSRNIEIITYDELFDRAKYISSGRIEEAETIETGDDLPF